MVNLVALLLCVIPMNDAVEDFVDLVETNRFHDEQGRLVFDQQIFYCWDEHAGRFQVVAWRMFKTNNQTPRYSPIHKAYVVSWHDTQTGEQYRKVYAKHIRETFTQYDPELIERVHFPKEYRSELTRGPPTSFMPSILNTDEGKRIVLERLKTTGCSRK